MNSKYGHNVFPNVVIKLKPSGCHHGEKRAGKKNKNTILVEAKSVSRHCILYEKKLFRIVIF